MGKVVSTEGRSFISAEHLEFTHWRPCLVLVQHQPVSWTPIFIKIVFGVLLLIFFNLFFFFQELFRHLPHICLEIAVYSLICVLYQILEQGACPRGLGDFVLPYVNTVIHLKLHFTFLLCTNDCIFGKYLVHWQFWLQLERIKAMALAAHICWQIVAIKRSAASVSCRTRFWSNSSWWPSGLLVTCHVLFVRWCACVQWRKKVKAMFLNHNSIIFCPFSYYS